MFKLLCSAASGDPDDNWSLLIERRKFQVTQDRETTKQKLSK